MPLDWQGAGILLVINVLIISYITSRKKTIVPSQSLDSVQQQHACKDVYKFFILPKKSLYRPQNYNNNPQKPNNPQQNNKIYYNCITALRRTMYHAPYLHIKHHITQTIPQNLIPYHFSKKTKDSTNSAKSFIFVGDKSQYVQHHIL